MIAPAHPPTDTADLELTLTAVGSTYELRMRLQRPGAGVDQRPGPFPVTIDRTKLRAVASDTADYGAALGEMLFNAAAGVAFTRLRAAALGSGEQLRVRLLLPPELHALPWELLRDPQSGRALAMDSDLLLSRYVPAADDQILPVRPRGRLRALIAVAAPADHQAYGLDRIDAAAEGDIVAAALAELQPTTISAGWDALSSALRTGYDIVYLVAHGMLDGNQPWLFLVDGQGNTDRRRGGALADLLRSLGERRPRLVVLTSCESAGKGYADALAALGPLLAQAGVPAVLAMQGRFSIATNQRFAPVLFRELLVDGLIDRAVNAARLAVADDRPDWWLPVLYTRLVEGRIWCAEATAMGVPLNLLHQLRAPVADFVGREQEIADLTSALTSGSGATISGLAGMGGIGKTELAMRVANDLREHYPDAQLVLNLQGSREPALPTAQALQQVIRAFLPDAPLPDDEESMAAAYRSVLSGKRALILADDARDAAQVKPLLPPAGSALLITSRQRFTLSGMKRIDLERLSEDAAITLLHGICDRLAEDEARQIATACGRLPLALRIAGGVLANDETLSVARYLARLADEKRRLAALKDPDDPDLDVAASIALSYELLGTTVQATLRQLGVFAASFDLVAAGSVLHDLLSPETQATLKQLGAFSIDFDLAKAEAALEAAEHDDLRSHLAALHRRSLIEFAQGRYDLHELVRVFALGKLGDNEYTARLRHALHYFIVATWCDRQYLIGGESVAAGLSLFDRERSNIDAARRWLQSVAGVYEVDQLLVGDAISTAHIGHLRYDKSLERIPQLMAAVAAAKRLGDRVNAGPILGSLGLAYFALGDARMAINFHQQHLALAREVGNRPGEGIALGNLGVAYWALGDARRAINFHQQHLALARETGDRQNEGTALGNLGNAHVVLSKVHTAIDFYQQHLALARETGARRSEGAALGNLGIAYNSLGDTHAAIDLYQQQLALAREIGDREIETAALGNLGTVYNTLGDTHTAIDLYQQQLALAREIGARHTEGVALGNLGDTYNTLGDTHTALDFYQQRLVVAREIGDLLGEADTMWAYGNILVRAGDVEQGLPYLEQSLACHQEIVQDFRYPRAEKVIAGGAYVRMLRAIITTWAASNRLLDDPSRSLFQATLVRDDAAFETTLDALSEDKRTEVLGEFHLDLFLSLIVAVANGTDRPRAAVENLLPQLEQIGVQIGTAVQRIWAGERDSELLTAGIDDNSARLVRHILELLKVPEEASEETTDVEDESTFSVAQEGGPEDAGDQPHLDIDQTVQSLLPLLGDIALATFGDEVARQFAESLLPKLEQSAWQLNDAILRIWAGERNAEQLTARIDPDSAVVVERILWLIEGGPETIFVAQSIPTTSLRRQAGEMVALALIEGDSELRAELAHKLEQIASQNEQKPDLLRPEQELVAYLRTLAAQLREP